VEAACDGIAVVARFGKARRLGGWEELSISKISSRILWMFEDILCPDILSKERESELVGRSSRVVGN
jgi:hypothetical protein